MIHLKDRKPFAKGGNRLCFVHPEIPDRCIKVRRPDFPLAALRRKKGFPKNLRPLSWFDDNAEEAKVMRLLENHFGEAIFVHVSRLFGFVETDLGRGLVLELIRDEGGCISPSLKQQIWETGYTEDCRLAVDALCRFWEKHGVPSRDLLLHNLVAQRSKHGEVRRLLVIDGLGSSNLVPSALLPGFVKRRKAKRKTSRFRERIQELLKVRETGVFPGSHGRLLHDR